MNINQFAMDMRRNSELLDPKVYRALEQDDDFLTAKVLPSDTEVAGAVSVLFKRESCPPVGGRARVHSCPPRWWGLQWGKIGENHLGDFCFFSPN